MHKILLAFFLLVFFLFPKSEVFAASCSSVGVDIYTTNQAGTRVGPVQNTPFNIQITDPKIKIGTKYKIVLSRLIYSFDTYELTAVEDAKMVGLGAVTAMNPGGPYYFTVYETSGGRDVEKCRSNNFEIISTAAAIAGPAAFVNLCAGPNPPPTCTKGSGLSCDPKQGTIGPGNGIYTAIGCIPTEPKEFIEGTLKFATLAAGGVAFIIMLLAALQMITAEGNPESIKAGQEKFYSAIIGLLLIIFSILLMQVIGVDILGLPGFGRQ